MILSGRAARPSVPELQAIVVLQFKTTAALKGKTAYLRWSDSILGHFPRPTQMLRLSPGLMWIGSSEALVKLLCLIKRSAQAECIALSLSHTKFLLTILTIFYKHIRSYYIVEPIASLHALHPSTSTDSQPNLVVREQSFKDRIWPTCT